MEYFDHDAEEVEIVVCVLIQPVESLPVLLTKFSCDPNHCTRVVAGRICKELSEMIVVCGLELILDDHHSGAI